MAVEAGCRVYPPRMPSIGCSFCSASDMLLEDASHPVYCAAFDGLFVLSTSCRIIAPSVCTYPVIVLLIGPQCATWYDISRTLQMFFLMLFGDHHSGLKGGLYHNLPDAFAMKKSMSACNSILGPEQGPGGHDCITSQCHQVFGCSPVPPAALLSASSP